ncbi:uncharacterized protein LOC143463307 [Clavelina lepadiformis]|uniref:uncharacterized protein LOC143463307 n=1 Tax=Clavelina lepadiformis TaxID=159417 RepID=UPI0040412230
MTSEIGDQQQLIDLETLKPTPTFTQKDDEIGLEVKLGYDNSNEGLINEPRNPAEEKILNCVETNNSLKGLPMLTLLQKALQYREQFPEKWNAQQKLRDKRIKESLGIFETDPFLESYYKKLDEVKKESEKLKKLRQLEPSKLVLQMEYNLQRKISSKNYETYESISATGVSVYDKDDGLFDIFKSHKQEQRGNVPELLITVTKGKYLLNHLEKGQEKFEKAKIKCLVHPHSDKVLPKLRSSYSYVNTKGTSRWNHVFVLKGFTANELAHKHVTLQLFGYASEQKTFIGEAFLCGSKVKEVMPDEAKHSRQPSAEEMESFSLALQKPGKTVTSTADLLREGKDHKHIANLMGLDRQKFNRKTIIAGKRSPRHGFPK